MQIMAFLIVIAILVATLLLWTYQSSRRVRSLQLELRQRDDWDMRTMLAAMNCEPRYHDKVKILLMQFASALSVPVGKLRPDDSVEHLISEDLVAVELLFKWERQIQDEPNLPPTDSLTLGQLIPVLAQKMPERKSSVTQFRSASRVPQSRPDHSAQAAAGH